MSTKIRNAIIALVGVELASAWVVSGDAVWYVDDVLDSTRIVVLCWLLSTVVHRHVSAWCIVVAYGACETVEAASNIIWYWFDVYNPALDALRVVIATYALGYYRYRRYDITSDTVLSPSHIYLTYRRPVTRQDRLLAMFGVPLGGVGVYCRGEWFHYSRGKFIISECQPNKNHVMIKSRKFDNDLISQLRKLDGTRWGILNNCMTEILSVVRLGRRPAWIPKPHY